MAETNTARDKPEEVQHISLSQIHPFPEHPFQVRDDELMQQTIDSIRQIGILTPVILRPDDAGGFEMISGHRRLYAAGLAGLETIPAIVRNMTDDEAIIFMVDSNLQRETILPSERAKAYKMKMDAIRRAAGRPSKNSVQVGQNFDGKTSDYDKRNEFSIEKFLSTKLTPKEDEVYDTYEIDVDEQTPAAS